ncbi:MAG: hypothetical protein H6608_09900 [Flavobacteriales bacterium]|nr:hypothetical protein [Bacteroidota bacterium]MCB9241435.1 hypothetical protein [Flavobacteriales bacterium]
MEFKTLVKYIPTLNDENKSILESKIRLLRVVVGLLGMALPILLVVFLKISSGYSEVLPSISHYYYTRVSGIFVVIMSILGLFLLIYTFKPADFIVSSIAALGVFLLLLFPTSNLDQFFGCSELNPTVTHLAKSDAREYVHYISAVVFLSCLAFMSLFLFTKSDFNPKDQSPQKRMRNKIYVICGSVMIAAMLVVLSEIIGWFPSDTYEAYNLTFWMEVVALESFGISWFVKGEVVLKG